MKRLWLAQMTEPEPTDLCNCILFDLDGTLYSSAEYSERFDYEAGVIVSRFIDLPLEKARALLKDGKSRYGTLTGTLRSLHIDREDFFQELAKRMDMEKCLSKDPSLSDLLSRLRTRGLKIGLVSNSGRPLVKKILSVIGLSPEQFDVVVTSSDARPKPSPEPFVLAMQRIGSNVQHSIYVGDRDAQELRPAKQLGMITILIDRGDRSTAQWADYVIRSLMELPELCETIRP